MVILVWGFQDYSQEASQQSIASQEMVLPLLQYAILKKETVEKNNFENNCMDNMLLY